MLLLDALGTLKRDLLNLLQQRVPLGRFPRGDSLLQLLQSAGLLDQQLPQRLTGLIQLCFRLDVQPRIGLP